MASLACPTPAVFQSRKAVSARSSAFGGRAAALSPRVAAPQATAVRATVLAAAAAPAVLPPIEKLDFTTKVFTKEKITLAGNDE